MADNQRIHPVIDAESPPTKPLVPPGSSISEKGSLPRHPHLPQRIAPVSDLRPPKPRNCCCRCLCWTILVLIILVIVIAATAGILYLVFQPKLPQYSVNSLRITDLRLDTDMTLSARFIVSITANNPNEKIGIYYEKGGKLAVWYEEDKLCEGSLPRFYQGHRNITKLDVALSGETEAGSTLMSALQEQQQTGRIPLDLKVIAPVAIKVGRLKLRKVRVSGNCLLVVDSLSTNNLISIKTCNCRFGLKL